MIKITSVKVKRKEMLKKPFRFISDEKLKQYKEDTWAIYCTKHNINFDPDEAHVHVLIEMKHIDCQTLKKKQNMSKRNYKFEVKRTKDAHQKFYFRIVADNGEILAHSESYHNEKDCMDAIFLIRERAPYAIIHDHAHEETQS